MAPLLNTGKVKGILIVKPKAVSCPLHPNGQLSLLLVASASVVSAAPRGLCLHPYQPTTSGICTHLLLGPVYSHNISSTDRKNKIGWMELMDNF